MAEAIWVKEWSTIFVAGFNKSFFKLRFPALRLQLDGIFSHNFIGAINFLDVYLWNEVLPDSSQINETVAKQSYALKIQMNKPPKLNGEQLIFFTSVRQIVQLLKFQIFS